MNERIKEIAKQSGLWFVTPREDLINDFAELIVQECVNTVENLSPGYQDYRNQIEDAFRRDCVEEIKQHFGVNDE